MTSARFMISGRVQGVAFRVCTRVQALALNLRGYARNLPDGRVEVLAVGDSDAIERLAEWLQQGPPLARVDVVVRKPAESQSDPSDSRSAESRKRKYFFMTQGN